MRRMMPRPRRYRDSRRKRHRHVRDRDYNPVVMADFFLKFCSYMATGVGRGWICLTLLSSSPTLGDISYTSWAIADFVSNFVDVAIGVGRRIIWLTSLDSLTPRTLSWAERFRRYLLYRRNASNDLLNAKIRPTSSSVRFGRTLKKCSKHSKVLGIFRVCGGGQNPWADWTQIFLKKISPT